MEGARGYRPVTGMPFADADGVSRVVMGRVYDFQAPDRRVRHPDRDGEEHSRREVTSRVARCRIIQTWNEASRRQRVQGRMAGRLLGKAHLTAGMPALGRRWQCVGQGGSYNARPTVRWRRKMHTLLPGYDQDACFMSTIVLCRAGGVLQRSCARTKNVEA